MKKLRIALMGAHGTGKTTLAKALVERLTSVGVNACRLPEAPRLICEHFSDPAFFRRGNNSPLRQTLILLVHLIQESESILGETEVLISDRSLLDHWAYTLHLFKAELDSENATSAYEHFIVEYCRSYDVIVFLPIEFDAVDDGVRESDPEFQKEIQGLMLGLAEAHGIKFIEVRGGIEERVDLCLNIISEKLTLFRKVE